MGFQNIYSKNIPGYLDYAGNTLGLNGACTSFSNIYTGCNSPGTSGVCGAWVTTDSTKHASENWNSFVNNLPYSQTNGGTTFDCTQNSSSDEISIPTGTIVDYAALIWSGNNNSNTVDITTREIDFTDPLNTLHKISPQYSFTNTSSYGYYTCATEVTSIVRSAGSGFYTTGNVYSEFLTNIACAGWLLIVVFKASTMPFYNININVGNLDVSGDSSASSIIAGFKTPPNGTDFLAKLILTALNGNPASPGDKVSLTDINNQETYLSGTLNPSNNFFGAQIEDIEGNICIDGTFGNLNATPNAVQTTSGRRMGYDIALVNTASALSNNQSSTTLTGSTTGNNFSITSATSMIENAAPYFRITTQTSDSTVLIGDSYTITYEIENIGTLDTSSLDFTFEDIGLDFLSGYYTVSGTTYTISSTPNALVLPNLDINSSITINLTFDASTIPNDLYYKNLSSLHYTFIIDNNIVENTLTNEYDLQISYINTLQITNMDSTSTTPPIIDPSDDNLSFSVVNGSSYGNVTITNSTITYTPNTLQQVTDRFVIKLLNTLNDKFINLVYNVNQVLAPSFNYEATQPSNINLYSTATCHYKLSNLSDFDITNYHIYISLAPGFLLSGATITDSQGQTSELIRTANDFTIGDLNAHTMVTITFIYEAAKLPTDLYYKPFGTSSFYFGEVNFTQIGYTDNIYPVANLDISVKENQVYNSYIPIIEPEYNTLSYYIKTQGNHGSASITSGGLLTYTPNTDTVGTDTVVVTVNNSQQNTTLDINYTFSIVPSVDIKTSLSFIIYKNVVFNEDISVTDNNYPNWTYSLEKQGNHGTGSVTSSGLLTYNPNTDFTGTDDITIGVYNSDIDTTIETNYKFTVVDPINPPCPDYIPYKLVQLLNDDIYLMALSDANISDKVCFDCTLWNNGYTSESDTLIIPPIKTTLITILDQLKLELQGILLNNSLNSPCIDASFKSQVERFLSIVDYLENKVILINCNTGNCSLSLFDYFISLLSTTLDTLIIITSTLNGLLGICSNNCTICTTSFSNLMGIFINSISDLYNQSASWNNMVINFIRLESQFPKSYIPSYVPPTIITPNTNNNITSGFICPPKM